MFYSIKRRIDGIMYGKKQVLLCWVDRIRNVQYSTTMAHKFGCIGLDILALRPAVVRDFFCIAPTRKILTKSHDLGSQFASREMIFPSNRSCRTSIVAWALWTDDDASIKLTSTRDFLELYYTLLDWHAHFSRNGYNRWRKLG